jgi:hypothetical protein
MRAGNSGTPVRRVEGLDPVRPRDGCFIAVTSRTAHAAFRLEAVRQITNYGRMGALDGDINACFPVAAQVDVIRGCGVNQIAALTQ